MLDGGWFAEQPDEHERHEARAGDMDHVCFADQPGQLPETGRRMIRYGRAESSMPSAAERVTSVTSMN